jgi:Lrp/AsnC family transcriptional regulator for asnA, asnC and gidA
VAGLPLLDERDKEILRILQRDARTPFSRIARMLGVSEATIHLRVRRLREAGVIKGFYAVLDPGKAGLPEEAYVFIRVEPGLRRRAAEKLSVIKGVYELYEVSGEHQLLAKIRAAGKEELAGIIDSIGSVDGVLATKTIYVLRPLKEEAVIDLGGSG